MFKNYFCLLMKANVYFSHLTLDVLHFFLQIDMTAHSPLILHSNGLFTLAAFCFNNTTFEMSKLTKQNQVFN